MSATFNQNHSGSGHNIINVGRSESPWKMNDVIAQKTKALLENGNSPDTDAVSVMSHGGPASDSARDELAAYLRRHGWAVTIGWKTMVVPPIRAAISIGLVNGQPEIVVDCYQEMPDASKPE